VVLVLSAIVAWRVASDFVEVAYDRQLYDSALDIARQLRYQGGKLAADMPPAALEMLSLGEIDRVFFEVRSPAGDFVLGSRGLPAPPPGQVRSPLYYDGLYQGQRLRLVALEVPVDPDDERAAAMILVGETLVERQFLANEILAAVAIPQALLMALAILSVYMGVGNGLRPLDRLRAQLARRSHRDLAPIDEPRTPREVRPLVHAINEMMGRLEDSLEAQRRFVADAAHQLRTPLAGLKTHAELALRETGTAEMRARIEALMHATDRSAHLASQLLALARAEPGAAHDRVQQPVDLASLARDLAAEWVPRALERSVDLGYSGPGGGVTVRGDAVLLREMLANLIDNAIRYGRNGARATVAIEASADEVRAIVEDDGPGIPVAERERVFERFQRLAESGPEGCGLGLAIVREIALGHGGRVEIVDPAHGAGTRIVVTLPRAEPGIAPGQPQ